MGLSPVAQSVQVHLGVRQPLTTLDYSRTVLADAPVGYWRLGEPSGTVAADASTGGNNGTYVGTPTLGATGLIANDANTAMVLTGLSSQWVELAAAPTLTDALSAEAWIKLGATAKGGICGFYQNGSPFSGWGFGYNITGGTKRLEFWSPTTGTWVNSGALTINDTTTKHHVVVTVTSGGTTTFYIDNVASVPVAGAVPTSFAGTKYLGRLPDLTGFLNATLDEVAIYDHVLPPGSIANHYAEGA